MSIRFRKALRLAQACARGEPPFPRERIYLCNWYVKLVRPGKVIPNDQVQCHVPMKMTKFDIRNYFEKIYDVRVAKVHTRIQQGKVALRLPSKTKKKKTSDVKVAYLTLVNGQTFTFPDIYGKYDREKMLRGERQEEGE